MSDGAAYINGDAIVIDGGKMLQSGGGGANTQAMIDWTDEQWEAIRPKKKSRSAPLRRMVHRGRSYVP